MEQCFPTCALDAAAHLWVNLCWPAYSVAYFCFWPLVKKKTTVTKLKLQKQNRKEKVRSAKYESSIDFGFVDTHEYD
jgi:hypothetical protein